MGVMERLAIGRMDAEGRIMDRSPAFHRHLRNDLLGYGGTIRNQGVESQF